MTQAETGRTGMRLTWLGHGGFRIEIADAVLLVDPWLRGNPVFDPSRFDEAVRGATHILVTHGHADHAADVPEIAAATGAPVVGIVDYVSWITARHGIEGVGFNMGGTVDCAGVAVTLVPALHSSTVDADGTPLHLGREAGFVLAAGGRSLYAAGDTDIHADMALIAELHRPQHAILPIGGHFTMDARRAAHACRRFFDFESVIPCHYATFPMLARSADEFVSLMGDTRVVVPEVMVPFAP